MITQFFSLPVVVFLAGHTLSEEKAASLSLRRQMTHLAFPFNRRFAEFILQKIPNLFMERHGHRNTDVMRLVKIILLLTQSSQANRLK